MGLEVRLKYKSDGIEAQGRMHLVLIGAWRSAILS